MFVFAKPSRQTCFLRPRRPRRPPCAPGNSPPHAAAASQQLRLLLRSRLAPSPLRRSSGFPSAPPRLGLRLRVPVISSRPGARHCTLPPAADGSQHSFTPCLRYRLVVNQRVEHPALSVSCAPCASRDGRLVPRCEATAAVSAPPSRAGESLSNVAYGELPHF